MSSLLIALAALTLSAIVIMYAADAFEGASGYLGRDMPPGVRGATINAIGSSLPELLTTLVFLFGPILLPDLYGSEAEGFSSGIATCAGSAVFNAVIIPALCVFAVTVVGVRRPDGSRHRIAGIEVSRGTVIRDGIFFVGAEVCLVIFLGGTTLAWWVGAALMGIYALYTAVLWAQVRRGRGAAGAADPETADPETADAGGALEGGGWGLLGLKRALNFNGWLFKGRAFSTGRAWAVLSLATAVIGVACAAVAWAVNVVSEALEINAYFGAVILAAAATSVPDTVLSVKDALKGEYDDAVANAVGSNIFDICVALGLPLLLYGLTVGDVHLSASADSAAADVQILRYALLAVTAVVLGLLLLGGTLTKLKSLILWGLYFGWTGFVIFRAVAA